MASFQLPKRPFTFDEWLSEIQYHTVGVSACSTLELPDDYTFNPPHVSEVNRFLGSECGWGAGYTRSELNDIGIMVTTATNTLNVGAVHKGRFATAMFEAIGINAEVSPAGLVAMQVVGQLGGLQGCRVLRIAGVRRLLRSYCPSQAFTRGQAERLIGDFDDPNRRMRFAQYENLTIDRDQGGILSPAKLFAYLLKRGVLQVGPEFLCPHCQRSFWKHLDDTGTEAL